MIYVLSSDQLCLYTPDGLISLFYFLTMIYFLPRVKKEVWKLTRGDFVRVRNSKGEVIGVLYVPKGTTKKDRGNLTVRDAAGYFKRPYTSRCSIPKLDFHTVLTELERHLDQLPFSGDRSTQPLFYQLKHVQHRNEDECFFVNHTMGEYSFDNIVRKAGRSCGLFLHPLQCQNQALR